MVQVRKFNYPVPEEQLLQDIEGYRRYAVELGADEARIIPAQDVIFDPRVAMKCLYPKCRWYGTNAHCPPYSPPTEKIKFALQSYRYGIFYRLRVDAADFTGSYNDQEGKSRPAQRQRVNYKIASLVEAKAFYDSYVLAMGFAGGPCKTVFCSGGDCTAIIPGGGCKAAGRARASLEGAGIYAFAMAAMPGGISIPVAKTQKEFPTGRL